MKISQILENAKAFLITEQEVNNSYNVRGNVIGVRGKSDYVCVAARRYIESLVPANTPDITISDIVYPVGKFVEDVIAGLSSDSYITFPWWAAKEILGMQQTESITLALKQKARHIWVDQMIAELKANHETDLDIDIESHLA